MVPMLTCGFAGGWELSARIEIAVRGGRRIKLNNFDSQHGLLEISGATEELERVHVVIIGLGQRKRRKNTFMVIFSDFE